MRLPGGPTCQADKTSQNPLLPSLFLFNARSITHKMDEMELLIANNNSVHDCYVIIIAETWLHPGTPYAAVQLVDHTLHHRDCSVVSSKSIGGGLCMSVHNDLCSQRHIIESHCSPDRDSDSHITDFLTHHKSSCYYCC